MPEERTHGMSIMGHLLTTSSGTAAESRDINHRATLKIEKQQ